MAKANPLPISFTKIIGGIADYDKESPVVDSVAFARQIDFRTNPRRWTILPRTAKESGSVITGLPVWGDRAGTDTYVYDDAGGFYKRTTAGSVSLLRSVANSHGNGLAYFGEDDFMYYTTDTTVGRYGYISATPAFSDDFLGAEGGVPLNTYALDLEASSSQYATAADSASLSITGDLALEINFKPESLPTAGNEMVLMAKWDKNSDERSYKFSVYAVSGYFGDGSDGALTISSNTTEAPIDSGCSGTSGAFTLSATNASFAANQIILIHQTRGTGAGTWQRTKIVSYTAGTITTEDALNYSYNSTGSNKAQVRVLKQYTDVTVNSGITYTAKAWDGTVGGILSFIANGTITVTGTITGTGKGFRGSAGSSDTSTQGEGTSGAGTAVHSANGNGAGGAGKNQAGGRGSGAGGGHAESGQNGSASTDGAAQGGQTAGTADLTTLVFGGAGSGAGGSSNVGAGGNGGGIIFLSGTTITITGSVVSRGSDGVAAGNGGGAGAGGSVLLKAQTATLGSSLIVATGGTGGAGGETTGGNGGTGRIHLDYYTSYTGTTSPTLNVLQDSNLVTNTTYQLRLQLSNDGLAEESLTRELSSIIVGQNSHLAVSWDASDHQAEFFEDGASIGSSTGAFTAIYNSTALFTLGASLNASSAAESFADGILDDPRLWASERTAAQILANKDTELGGSEAGLNAYWQLDNSGSDSTANANNLTPQNSPVYVTTVPFASPTTRLDIDQTDTSTGSTYTLQTAIDEGASHRQSFVPAKDPQKSIGVYIDTIGTGVWTLTVHDGLNRTIASKSVAAASLNTGFFEFVFDDVWRPIIGATYHFHVTVSTGTSKVVSGTLNNHETAEFKSYYQFLVDDNFHPISHTGNFISIGNERYVATYDASSYDPHRLTFPAGWHVRCIAKWREYYAYGCFKGDTIYDYDQGIIFFWDGFSTKYNFFVEVPEGGINALFGDAGTLYIVAGYQGDILEYTGGDKARKVKRIPKVTDDAYVEVLPGALNMWRTLLQVGVGVTDSADVEQGVYSWGKRNENFIDALSFDYKISTGTIQSTGLKIGLVLPVNKKLLIGWKDNVSYGLDSVDPAGVPYSDGSIEWMIRDEDAIWKEKIPNVIRADFETLAGGDSVGLQLKLNRADSWSTEALATYAASPQNQENEILRYQPNVQDYNAQIRHREYQVRLNLHTTNSVSPAALGLTVMEDAITDEKYA